MAKTAGCERVHCNYWSFWASVDHDQSWLIMIDHDECDRNWTSPCLSHFWCVELCSKVTIDNNVAFYLGVCCWVFAFPWYVAHQNMWNKPGPLGISETKEIPCNCYSCIQLLHWIKLYVQGAAQSRNTVRGVKNNVLVRMVQNILIILEIAM